MTEANFPLHFPLQGRKILLGVSGSIAAYKAADLCSQLAKLGADVHVVLTEAAAKFVGKATFRALTRNPVVCDLFDEPTDRRIAHIDLAQSADLVLLAPASADLLARMAHGMADDMLTTCLLATPPRTPVLVAPAMNTIMWEHPATVANVQTLTVRGITFIAPATGLLACQDFGTGKLAPVEEILQAVCARLGASTGESDGTISAPVESQRNLTGKRLLVTAGATREPLDPVRFLSNRSSGKMGYALAQAAAERGATVTLISAFATATVPPDIEIVHVQTADEMLAACLDKFPECDIFIAAAAVADYAPETVQPHKIKKPTRTDAELQNAQGTGSDEEIVTLRLKRTPDVVATIGKLKSPGQFVIGFAAETDDLLANATAKIVSKRLDLIVANDVLAAGAGFETDTNIVTLLWPDGRTLSLGRDTKLRIAHKILHQVSGASC